MAVFRTISFVFLFTACILNAQQKPKILNDIVENFSAYKNKNVTMVLRLKNVDTIFEKIVFYDSKNIDILKLRKQLGFVTQDAQLFSGTIRENLLFVKPNATDEEIINALQRASCGKLLDRAENGLDSTIGEGGIKISGGEKQRLAIARLLLKSPSIVILDEATAHLDSENEELVQKALAQALRGRTSIVIAHRLSTVMGADQIIVLENGSIAERGKHEELVQTGGLYSELFARQDLTTPN